MLKSGIIHNLVAVGTKALDISVDRWRRGLQTGLFVALIHIFIVLLEVRAY
jgi:hypothetical protein